MKYLHFPPELAAKTIRLNEAEMRDPQRVIDEFFSFYDLNHIRTQLGSWLEYAYASDDDDMKEAVDRINLMQFSFQVEALCEAVYLLQSAAAGTVSSGKQ